MLAEKLSLIDILKKITENNEHTIAMVAEAC